VFGFVAVAAFVSLVEVPENVLEIAGTLSKVLILAALVGIGIGATSLKLDRSLAKPLLVGLGAGVIVAAVGLGATALVA
jgi:uncharacterized membrane protein YadS